MLKEVNFPRFGVPRYLMTDGHDRFEADPYFYLSGNKAKKKPPVANSTKYTCPMDPEIVQDGPGTCPICGMALEPMGGVAEGPNTELVDFTRRLWVSAGAAIPLLILTMGPMIGLPVREWLGERVAVILEFLLATPVVLWAGWPFFVRGWNSLRTRNLNMFTLIAMGTGVAWAYSMVALLAPGIDAAWGEPAEVSGFGAEWTPDTLPGHLADAIRDRDLHVEGW